MQTQTDQALGKLAAYLHVLDHNIQVSKEPHDEDDVVLEIDPILPSRLLPVRLTIRDLRALRGAI
jgi:hypothetical protein